MNYRASPSGIGSRSSAALVILIVLQLLVSACASDGQDPAAVPEPGAEPVPEAPDDGEDEPDGLTSISFVYSLGASGSALNWVISRELGFFTDVGIDVELLEPGAPGQGTALVGAGSAEFGQEPLPTVLDARAQGVPIVSIGCQFQKMEQGIMAPVEAGIASPRDLEGKTVGQVGAPIVMAMFDDVLEANDVDTGSVETVIAGGGVANALVTGSVDAIVAPRWGTGPVLAAAASGDPTAFNDLFTFLPLAEWGAPEHAMYCIITNEAMLESHPDVVRDFLLAWERGILWARDNMDEAVRIYNELHPEEGYDLSFERWRMALEFTETGLAMAHGYGWQDPEQWTTVAEFMFDRGLSEELVDVSQVFTNNYIPGNSP